MMNPQSQHIDHVSTNEVSLQLLLNNLVNNLPETIFRNKISVKNKVAAEFKMNADRDKIVPVIDEVLNTVVSNARNTSISITAERYSDIVILNFEDPNNYNGYALQFSLLSVGQSARHVGGDINIYGAQQREATVSFSFPDTQTSC
ncbi:hypothetical protein [Terrimonas alba]|uniref:hypothetical protein n=1 Tax=Terrimonas alba TaxID=3349636 RepID=UPI0035F4851F